MQDFDKLWNYSNPAETETKFREALAASSAEKDVDYHVQLLTQIARTHSLRRNFTEAHALLNEAEAQLNAAPSVGHIRYQLERGRCWNSAGDKAQAKHCFEQAEKLAADLQEDFYRIDAIHMLAIVSPPVEAMQLNEQAILVAEASTQERAKNWLGALYNNLGWTCFDNGQYEKALSIFLRALQWRESKQQAPETFLAKWCVARTLRALNKLEEALKIQLALMEEMIETDRPDGFVYEELGELHLAKNEEVHKMYFKLAFTELSKDAWLLQHEAKRMERIKELGEVVEG